MQRTFIFVKNLIRIAPGAAGKLGLAVFFAGLAALAYPVPIVIGWHVICGFLDGTGTELTVYPVVTAILFVVCCILFRVLSAWFAHLSAARVSRALRLRLMDHLGKLPLHWFSSQETGGLKKVLNTDVGEIEKFISHHITDIVTALCLPFIMIMTVAWADWRLALLPFFLMAYAVHIQVGSYKDIEKSQFMQRYNQALAMLHVDSVDFVQGMPDIKIFNRTTASFGRMRDAVDRLDKMQAHSVSVYGVRWANYIAVIGAPITVIGIAGAALHLGGSLSLDHYILAVLIGSISLVPLISLLRFSSFVMRTYYSCRAIDGILTVPVEKKGSASQKDVASARIVVDGLCKEYGDKPVLSDIRFTADPGTVTALVGMSGSGKSTLAAILAGMEKADHGTITLGGVQLSDLPASELSACFSIVFQTPFIFSGTVMDNIRLGSEKASDEAVVEAARMTCAAGFIERLPLGYDTMIGAGGLHLSGGQHQRIALARMALRNTPVVLLDEATAFADPESEAAIQQGLSAFLADKTVLVIAHRLRSIARADQIIVLDRGRVAQRGTHDALLAADGIYARLWDADATARSWTIRNNTPVPAIS